jgi:hypothetical protein
MLKVANTALTTVGAGTITAVAIMGQIITRSGPVGGFTDTTDTAAKICAGLTNMGNAGSVADPVTWILTYINTTGQTATLAAGSGVTLNSQAPTPGAGVLTVPASQAATILVAVVPSAGVATLTILSREAIATV